MKVLKILGVGAIGFAVGYIFAEDIGRVADNMLAKVCDAILGDF